MSVLSVVKVWLEPTAAPKILDEASHVLDEESKTRAGFIAGEILVSSDSTKVVILTEWTDPHAWSQSRYDGRVGKMLEDCLIASTKIEFEVYDRHARFFPTRKEPVVDYDRGA